jgi:hypothetical protein
MTEASLEQNLAAARHEHLVHGREIHLQDVRGQRFCEVGLITGTNQENSIANIWNTTGACDPTPEQFDELDADTLAREHQAVRAWLNPVRHWMFDRLDVWEAGDDRAFGSITGTWMGAIDAATLMPATDRASYDPGYIYSNKTFTFGTGREVCVLDAPDGEVFIMQSVTRQWEPTLRDGDSGVLGRRLELPAGWGFRIETLDEDIEVSSNPDHLAHVLQDNLRNVYLGSDAGRAFSQLAPMDSLW